MHLDLTTIHPLYDSYAAAEKKDWAIKMQWRLLAAS
jgi:hypothetical protein